MTTSLSREQARAADIVEAMYAAAQKIKVEANPRLWDPRANPTLRRVVIENALVFELGERYRNPREYDREYANATDILAPLIRDASTKWTLEHLKKLEDTTIGKVDLFVSQFPNLLENAARDVIRNLPRIQGQELTSSEMKAITGESGNEEGGSVPERLERVTYMRTVSDLRAKANDDNRLAFENLYRLMVHPKGVRLVNMFARSSTRGREYASGVIQESLSAIGEMREGLRKDKSRVWRLPVAIAGGVGTLSSGARPGLMGFALAWARWGTPSTVDNVLDIAENALLALQLVGGPIGALLGEALDIVLGVIGTAVQFVRDLEQDQAANAGAFTRSGDRLSQGSSFASTALMGASTIVAAFLPGPVSQIAKRAVGAPKQLIVNLEKRVVAAPDIPDARLLNRRGVHDAGVKATDRLADNARRTGDNGTITTGKTIDADSKTKAVANNGKSDNGVSASAGDNAAGGNGTGGISGTGAGDAGGIGAGAGGNGTGGKGTGGKGTGGGGPPLPPKPKITYAGTRTSGVDNRHAGGGIYSINEWPQTAGNRRKVVIEGRINLITGPVPESIFIREQRSAAWFGLKDYANCHLFPLQWGDEAAVGFMHGHGPTFNGAHQKRLENYVRRQFEEYPVGAELHTRITALSADRTKHGGNLLEQIRYEFWSPGGPTTTIEFDVEPPPSGKIVLATPFAY